MTEKEIFKPENNIFNQDYFCLEVIVMQIALDVCFCRGFPCEFDIINSFLLGKSIISFIFSFVVIYVSLWMILFQSYFLLVLNF